MTKKESQNLPPSLGIKYDLKSEHFLASIYVGLGSNQQCRRILLMKIAIESAHYYCEKICGRRLPYLMDKMKS